MGFNSSKVGGIGSVLEILDTLEMIEEILDHFMVYGMIPEFRDTMTREDIEMLFWEIKGLEMYLIIKNYSKGYNIKEKKRV